MSEGKRTFAKSAEVRTLEEGIQNHIISSLIVDRISYESVVRDMRSLVR